MEESGGNGASMYQKRKTRQYLYRLPPAQGYKKALARIVRLCAKLSVIVLASYAGYRTIASVPHYRATFTLLSQPQTMAFSCDHFYSTTLQEAIVHTVDQLVTGSTFYHLDGATLYQELKKPFPLVSSCRYDIDHQGKLSVVVNGTKPEFLINEQFIVGMDQRLYDKELFEEVNPQSLYSVTLSEQYCTDFLDGSIYQFLQKIPNERWTNYTIKYTGTHAVQLRPVNQEKKYRVKADENSFFDDRKLLYVDQLYEQLKNQQQVRRRQNRWWVFDIRFDKRIVVRLAREGEGDE